MSLRATCALVIVLTLSGCGSTTNAVPPAHAGFESSNAVASTAGVRPELLDGYPAAQTRAEAARRDENRRGIQDTYQPQAETTGLRRVLPIGSRTEPGARTLVLYDTSGPWGFLGEIYAIAVSNLAGHFGSVDTEPIASYRAGQIQQYNAAIYVGSTYYEASADPIPPAFYDDVYSGSTNVLWLNDNIWNFALHVGEPHFKQRYGWDPVVSYFDPNGTVGDVTEVDYKGQRLSRAIPSGHDSGLLHCALATGSGITPAQVLANAVDSHGNTVFPWAVRSGNLTYVSEIPFDYISETDRVIAFEDLLFDELAPRTPERHRALLRLGPITANSDLAKIQSVASYLATNNVPYAFSVVPYYVDALGYYHNGKPTTISLQQAPKLTALIVAMRAGGGTLISDGYTHQYGAVKNPYTGASGDDAEFFRVALGTNSTPVWETPVSEDSASWAQARAQQAVSAFTAASIPPPSIWMMPGDYASDTDYRAIGRIFPARLGRAIYFYGDLSGQPAKTGEYLTQYFPYAVTDVYGTTVLPENLGGYAPSGRAARSAAQIIHEAQLNLAVRDGAASFYYDPSYGVTQLQQIIEGLRAEGYTFVSPSSLM